jgi:hypothetical protein
VHARVAVLAVGLAALGCDPDGKLPNEPIACTAIAVSALNVTTRDGATGAPICNASVIAMEGAGPEIALRQTGQCTYAGAEERAGEFRLYATAPGYETTRVAGVVVGRDECHVIPVRLTVDLQRN